MSGNTHGSTVTIRPWWIMLEVYCIMLCWHFLEVYLFCSLNVEVKRKKMSWRRTYATQ